MRSARQIVAFNDSKLRGPGNVVAYERGMKAPTAEPLAPAPRSSPQRSVPS
jgi:hypothetical protein